MEVNEKIVRFYTVATHRCTIVQMLQVYWTTACLYVEPSNTSKVPNRKVRILEHFTNFRRVDCTFCHAFTFHPFTFEGFRV